MAINPQEPAGSAEIPSVPLTLDGSYILHQMFRIRWREWRAVRSPGQKEILDQATGMFAAMEAATTESSALFTLVGHKGDLMIVHFRKTLDALSDAQLQLSRSSFHEFLEPTSSYVSAVELGLYEASVRLYTDLAAQGLAVGTAEWNRAIDAELAKQRNRRGLGSGPRFRNAATCAFIQ